MSQELYDREREYIARIAREIRQFTEASTFDHRKFIGPIWLAGKPIHGDECEVSQGRLIYAIGRILKPINVYEVGIGPGITAHSLVSAAEDAAQPYLLHYHGVDVMASPWQRQAVTETIENLESRAGCGMTWNGIDSDKLNAFTHPTGRIDLIHIDGDHSFDHQRRDVEKAIASGAEWLLVDDCNDTEVACAVFAAWKNQLHGAWRGGLLPMIYFEHSRTGSMLFHLNMWKGQ